MKELNTFRQYLTEGVIKEEVDVLGNEFTQEIQDDMKMYYKMDVDMDDIKDWVNMYYIGYNSEYDEGPGDVDYEGNEFGSEDYESEKKELVFDTAEREDFYMHLNPEADSTFPNLKENEEQGYTLYDTKVEYDNGKTGYMFQLVNSEDREENEIGFDQLFFDDEDNRLEMGVDFNSFDQGSYQEGEYTADEAMELYRKISESVVKENDKNDYANSEEDYTDEMVIEKIKDIIKYHELDPQDLIDEIRIEFGVDAMD